MKKTNIIYWGLTDSHLSNNLDRKYILQFLLCHICGFHGHDGFRKADLEHQVDEFFLTTPGSLNFNLPASLAITISSTCSDGMAPFKRV